MRLPEAGKTMTRADALGLSLVAALLGQWLIIDLSPAGIIVPVVIYLALLLDGVFRPAAPWLMPVAVHGSRQRPQVALTFDDGPDAEVTPQVLDALKQAGAKASFFTIGRHLDAHPELAARIHAEGHELGNHSYDHSRMLNFARPPAMRAEILKGAEAVAKVTARQRLPLYRPPVGLKNPPLARVVEQLGLKIIAWSLHSRDTRMDDPQAIAERVLSKVKPGDIILMHDGHDLPGATRPATAEALRRILQGLEAKGLESVTVSELLRAS